MKPIITPLLEISHQLQIYHWQTKSYAEHKAFGETYDTLTGLIDEYVESMIGRTDRIFAQDRFSISLENYSEESVQSYLINALRYLQSDLPVEINDEPATELANIRDEMVQSITKLKYLLSLK